ncbi:S24 family peptidase [Campylobacter hyointestinalis subsp. lawsonii]|nr:S24 family peptidase [Campylobacter hyointestinalis subsp. lawsonii]
MGVDVRTLQNYEKDETIPDATVIAKLAKIFNITPQELLGESVVSNVVSDIEKSVVSHQNSVVSPINLKKSQNEIYINIKEDTVYVPFFKDGAVSAGFGTEDFGNDCDFLPFKKQDLRLMFGAHSTANIGIIPCVGNSMQPTIEEGELVVFQQDNTQSEGAIYVVRFENELFVKRLKKRPLQLVSDNKEYEPISLGEFGEIEILGRVIGSYSINTKRF